MTIVLDAMGSDQYPDPEIQAAVELIRTGQEKIILVGNEEIIESRLKILNPDKVAVPVVHAPDILEMSDKPVEQTRQKSKNSMSVGLELVKSGQGQAFVTAGNTGAAMFNALLRLGRIRGVMRPALTAIFPVHHGRAVVLDIGANADCKPEFLLQFAAMGSVYAKNVMGIENPRVGLLSNGEEPGKGNQLIKESFPLIEKSNLNFIGNVESKEVFGGKVDVVVTDGFTGNVLLKTSEAVAKLITTLLREEIMKTIPTKIGGALAKPAFLHLRKIMDPGEYGAAPLLGIDGLVFIGHGRSDARAIMNAVRVARHAIVANLLQATNLAIQEQMSVLTHTS